MQERELHLKYNACFSDVEEGVQKHYNKNRIHSLVSFYDEKYSISYYTEQLIIRTLMCLKGKQIKESMDHIKDKVVYVDKMMHLEELVARELKQRIWMLREIRKETISNALEILMMILMVPLSMSLVGLGGYIYIKAGG